MIFTNKFKNFYPKWYRDKMETKFNKRNVRILTCLLIGNLLLAPNLIFLQKEIVKNVTKDMLDDRKKISSKTTSCNNELLNVFKNLKSNDIRNFTIQNGEFIFEIPKDKFNEDLLELNNNFKIKSIKSAEDSEKIFKIEGGLSD